MKENRYKSIKRIVARLVLLGRNRLLETNAFISLDSPIFIMVRKIGVHKILEARAARSKNLEISPRPVGPRFLEIAIIVIVETAIVGT